MVKPKKWLVDYPIDEVEYDQENDRERIKSKEIYGNAWSGWVYDDAIVKDNAKIFDNAQARDYAQVYGTAELYDNATVMGHAQVHDAAQVEDNAKISDDADVFGPAVVGENKEIKDDRSIYAGSFSDCFEIVFAEEKAKALQYMHHS